MTDTEDEEISSGGNYMELLIKDGKYYRKGPGRPKELNDIDILTAFLKTGVSLTDATSQIEYAKFNAEPMENKSGLDISTQKIEVIRQYNPFKNFKIINNQTNGSQAVYYQKGIDTEFICAYPAFDNKSVKATLEKYDEELLINLHKNLSKLINSKDWTQVSILQSLDSCFNSGILTEFIERIVVTQDPHPACVQGIEKFSLVTIPYSYKKSGIEDLNSYLKDFLERTEHHDYLCAILWSNFIGNMLPYVLYLRGDGGDGKTSFINMLGKLARSYANFDNGDRFNYFNMFGKSIIGLNENESSKLMQNRVVKSITGGNLVQVEGKGKNSFPGQVRGLILIDSNYDLELMNREDEKRRLRYFEVKSINKTINHITIAQDTFLSLLGSTPNEFLNYCRECYENLNIEGSGGLIKETPNHEETFLRLTDPLQEYKFDEFYKQHLSKFYYIEKGSKCDTVDILLALEKKFPKDQWVIRNFKKYLDSKYKIKVSGKFFIGLVKGNKELEEVMPK